MASTSADSSIEESEISRISRAERERRRRIDDINKELETAQEHVKELQLFDMNNNDDAGEEEDDTEEQRIEECPDDLNQTLPGIKFFVNPANCDYDQNSIRREIDPLKQYSELDLKSLTDLKEKVSYLQIGSFNAEKELFTSLMKLLFTCQSRSCLDEVSKILILLARKPIHAFPLLNIIIDTLPLGLKNLGGKINEIFEPIEYGNRLRDDVALVQEINNYNPVENIRYVVNILQYTVTKAYLYLNGKLTLPIKTVDKLVYILLVVSEDPQILSSSVIPSIQNCLAQILDLYPPDFKDLMKIQDIVERIAYYWNGCPEGFSHITAYMVCYNIIPPSVRGKQLKGSLAYCSLVYCVPDCEVVVVDKITLYALSNFCRENASSYSQLSYQTLYSVFRLIDAAISRPILAKTDKVHLTSLMEIIEEIYSTSSGDDQEDWSFKPELETLIRELTMQWSKLIESPSESNSIY